MDLSARDLLQTTRAVRKRLDLHRFVEPEVIEQCIEIAIQAPTGSNNQHWHFIVVTDIHQRHALGELYRKGFAAYRELAFGVETGAQAWRSLHFQSTYEP